MFDNNKNTGNYSKGTKILLFMRKIKMVDEKQNQND